MQEWRQISTQERYWAELVRSDFGIVVTELKPVPTRARRYYVVAHRVRREQLSGASSSVAGCVSLQSIVTPSPACISGAPHRPDYSTQARTVLRCPSKRVHAKREHPPPHIARRLCVSCMQWAPYGASDACAPVHPHERARYDVCRSGGALGGAGWPSILIPPSMVLSSCSFKQPACDAGDG